VAPDAGARCGKRDATVSFALDPRRSGPVPALRAIDASAEVRKALRDLVHSLNHGDDHRLNARVMWVQATAGSDTWRADLTLVHGQHDVQLRRRGLVVQGGLVREATDPERS
jgi:hypothetical protein